MTKQFVSEDWIYIPDTLTLSYLKNDKTVVLDPKIGKTLEYLLEHGHESVTRDDIYFELFGYETIRSDNTISSYISRLRKIIEPKSELKNKYIRTIPKKGYQFIGTVEIQQFVCPPPKEKTLILETPQQPDASVSLDTAPESEAESDASRQLLRKLVQWKVLQINILLFVGLLVLGQFFWPSLETQLQAYPSSTSALPISYDKAQVVVHDNGSEQDFDLTPDLNIILYVQVDEVGTQYLKLQNLSSGDIRTLYQTNDAELLSPVIAPDQTSVSFIQTNTTSCDVLQLPVQLDDLAQTTSIEANRLTGCGDMYFMASVAYLDDDRLIHTHAYNDKALQVRIKMYDRRFKRSGDLFLPPPQSVGDYNFTLSPDQAKLAFVRYISADSASLYLYDFNSLEISRLGETPSAESELRWLDNEHLIYVLDEQLNSLNINSLQQQTLSQKVNDLRSPRVINGELFARQGPWLSFDIQQVNLTDFSLQAVINSQYSEYMPQVQDDNHIYYGSTKTGDEQVWLYAEGKHKQISQFQQNFKIIDIHLANDALFVLNKEAVIKLSLQGEILERFEVNHEFSQIIKVKGDTIIGMTSSTDGSFLASLNLYPSPLTSQKLMAVSAVNYDPSDDSIWLIPTGQQHFLQYYGIDFTDPSPNKLDFPSQFSSADMWHVFNDQLYFYNKQRAFKQDLNTEKVENLTAPNFFPSQFQCKNVAKFCYMTSVSNGRTEIIRFR